MSVTRDCHIGIRINSGTEVNLVDEYGFHLIESPSMVVPTVRDYDIQEYPDSAEAEIDPRTTMAPFDYTLSLVYFGDESSANAIIKSFFDSLFTTETGSDILTALPIEVKNYWKGVKMNGYAKTWDGTSYAIDGENAAIGFDFTIYVSNPKTFLPI